MTTLQRPAEFNATHDFQAHGQVRVAVSDGLTVSHVRGPWNLELVQAWIAAFGQQRPALQRQPALGGHGAIIVVEHSAMATPEAIALMRKGTEYSMAHYGLRLGALVLPDGVEGRQLAARTLGPVWEGLVPYQVFDTLASATAWVRQTLG